MSDDYVLLIQDDGGDYYVGHSEALYANGDLVWSGYSNDEAEKILRAVFADRLTVRRVKHEWDRETESYFTTRIDGDADG